ncbi:MAG: hypothetical protein IJD77_00990 [Clostridia bacterium]|nr:hypothetical protein [Clostridia bacterium]
MQEAYEQQADDGVKFSDKLTAFLKNNVYDIAIVLICVARIVFGLAEIEKTGNTIGGIIGDSAITLVFAIVLSRLLEGKGFLAGETTDSYKKALEDYQHAARSAGTYITRLDKWCKEYSEKEYKAKITTMLLPLGLSYEQFIENEYDEEKFSDVQKKHLAKVKHAKVPHYTTQGLMSGDLEINKEIDYSKTTKRNYIKKSTRSDFGTKTVLAVIFGYFTLPPMMQWNWAGALWALIHTVITLGLSIMKYFSAYNFINDEMRAKLVDKTSKLTQFVVEMKEEGVNENVCTE